MFGRRSASLWKPKNPHSLEYLKYLHGVLQKNQTVTESNRGMLVEALRSISEILIWGDQNDSSVFDFFLEKNMLSFFLRIMKQKCGRFVCTQLLQTLNILFENIRHETSLYYLLSNNHVNSIITHRFDFSDEEILAYYISFLKTLSLKLNKHSIHFFFNEHTNDFPLYTEAIKFFNHTEGMVRIAVRTLTLNVYRVGDVPMLKFIRDKTAAPYFSNLVWFVCNHILEIEIASQMDQTSDDLARLTSLIDEQLDHLHYVNDIMRLDVESLNVVLSDQLTRKLFLPLCLGSIVPNIHEEGPHVSIVMALFILSQAFLILDCYSPLLSDLAAMLLFGDRAIFEGELIPPTKAREEKARPPKQSEASSSQGRALEQFVTNNSTDEEKLKRLSQGGSLSPAELLEVQRPLYHSLLASLDCTATDHASFFGICTFYALCTNSAVSKHVLEAAGLAVADQLGGYNAELVGQLVKIITLSTHEDSPVRVATLDTAILLLRHLVPAASLLFDQHYAALLAAKETIIDRLRLFYQVEEMFLDIFENEYHQFNTRRPDLHQFTSDAALVIPPTSTPLSGIDIVKRLPNGEQERCAKAVRTYFALHQVLLALLHEVSDPRLPLVPKDHGVSTGECLNLNKADLLSCVVMQNDTKLKRFLVTDGFQMILVEPDSTKMGWGIVRFAGLLQDVEVTGDKEDSRALHVSLHQVASTKAPHIRPRFSARFLFDDHIRCMAAKQRLTKGRQKARQYKMDLIAELLDIAKHPSPPPQATLKQLVCRAPGLVPGCASKVSLEPTSSDNSVASTSSGRTSRDNKETVRRSQSPASAAFSTIQGIFSKRTASPKRPDASLLPKPRQRRVRVLSSSALNQLSTGQHSHEDNDPNDADDAPYRTHSIGPLHCSVILSARDPQSPCERPRHPRSTSLSPTLLRRHIGTGSSTSSSSAPTPAPNTPRRTRTCALMPQQLDVASLPKSQTVDFASMATDETSEDLPEQTSQDLLQDAGDSPGVSSAPLQCFSTSASRTGRQWKKPPVHDL